jgi:hypothetical protein
MAQFVAYFIFRDGEALPISTGPTRDIASTRAIERAVSRNARTGIIDVQSRDDIPADLYAQLSRGLDDAFKGARSADLSGVEVFVSEIEVSK